MIKQELLEIDPDELPFIDKEINDERHIDEAINQVQACICSLEYNETKIAKMNAKEVLRVIRKNLNWEKYDELKNKVIKLQSLLYQG
ncbi:hypothetical protein [Acinetobacter bereziniae]|uniref:hypothetical protein n=1 Tax=Acinetobacter bereziniae TaxID=106648 RepID=UPI0018FF15A7|nr:hypothetical protein [Acinetobacter bereziniae]MBJ8475365.1 hypothetical protein [Acinetobacter bereziniae]